MPTVEQRPDATKNLALTAISAPSGGAVGAYICFPFEGIKKRLQSGQRVQLNLRELFRGSTAFSGSVALNTLMAMAVKRSIECTPGYDRSSITHEAGSALGAGVVGAFVGSTPVENIILVQQLKKLGPIGAICHIFSQSITRLWVGFPELACREAGFAGCMLYFVDKAEKVIQKRTGSVALAQLGGFGVGIFGAIATQPFDMIATIKQKSEGTIRSRDAIRDTYREQGLLALWRGGGPRVVLFSGCAYIIPKVEDVVYNILAYFSNRIC